jgi:hypothetical protein
MARQGYSTRATPVRTQYSESFPESYNEMHSLLGRQSGPNTELAMRPTQVCPHRQRRGHSQGQQGCCGITGTSNGSFMHPSSAEPIHVKEGFPKSPLVYCKM